VARVTRPILDRDRPVRSWASAVSPGQPRAGSDTSHAGPDVAESQDPILRGVVSGGRVVDEWIRQAQQTARMLGGTESNRGWVDTSGQIFKTASDMMAAWWSLFGLIPPNGGPGFGNHPPGVRPEATWAATPSASRIPDEQEPPQAPARAHADRVTPSSAGPRIKLEIGSRRPVNVTFDLHRNGIALFRVLDLRAESGDAPRILGTTLEAWEPDGFILRLTVPDDQPPGAYHAVILDPILDSAVGIVTLRIPD
jgi:hypothetical protein